MKLPKCITIKCLHCKTNISNDLQVCNKCHHKAHLNVLKQRYDEITAQLEEEGLII